MPDEPAWMTVVIPALLRHARTTYAVAMRDALVEAGFDDVPGNGLYVIGALHFGEMSLSRIIRGLRVSKQAAGQLIDTLVLRGYLDRKIDETDRRRLTVTLTERGRAAAAAQTEARMRIDAELDERVGSEKILHAREVLGTLIDMNRESARSDPE